MVFSPAYFDEKYDMILEAITEKNLFSNIVLIIGRHGTGKTQLLSFLAERKNFRLINVGLCLSQELRQYSDKERLQFVESSLKRLIPDEGTVLLDNTEILFQPELKLNVMRLILNLGRSRKDPVIISVAGIRQNGCLYFSEPPFSDNKQYDIHDFYIVDMGE